MKGHCSHKQTIFGAFLIRYIMSWPYMVHVHVVANDNILSLNIGAAPITKLCTCVMKMHTFKRNHIIWKSDSHTLRGFS